MINPHRALQCLICAVSFALITPPCAAMDDAQEQYLSLLVSKANEQRLADHPVWRALVHYRPDFWYGTRSEVDGENFFLAPRGPVSPQQELEATLAGFFNPEVTAPRILSAQCGFPARYAWLKAQLNFDPARLPEQACPKLDDYRRGLNAHSITIVFPTTQPSSPSSMFGHTLLRFDRPNQDKNTRVLAYTATYAANADTANDVLYAIKGITGNFIGRFSVQPYYLKLREYAQMENRDVWEYQLNLSQAQVDLVVLHTYELALTHFNYYFFTKNCSYQLMALLAVAAPELNLTEYNGWVIPVDTLKQLTSKGLVTEIRFQPSHRATILARRKLLSPDEEQLAEQIFVSGFSTTQQQLNVLDPPHRAAVMDLAYDYHRYTKLKNATVVEPKITEGEREFLLARSQIGISSEVVSINAPRTPPDQGHGTARASLGLGTQARNSYTTLGVRAAYHSLLDPAEGFNAHSQLEFMNTEFRYFPESHQASIEKITVVDILALEPRSNFFRDGSWRINTGWVNRATTSDKTQLAYSLNGGPGMCYQIGETDTYAFGFLEGTLDYGRNYTHDFTLQAGASAGLLINTGFSRTLVMGKRLNSIAGDDRPSASATLQQGFSLGKNLALDAAITRQRFMNFYSTDVSAKLNVYF